MEAGNKDDVTTSIPRITITNTDERSFSTLNIPRILNFRDDRISSKWEILRQTVNTRSRSLDNSQPVKELMELSGCIIDSPNKEASLLKPIISPVNNVFNSDINFPISPPSEVEKLIRNNPTRTHRRASICLDALSNECYYELLTAIDEQIRETIQKSIYLHNQKYILDRLIFSESVIGLMLNFFGTIITTSNMNQVTLVIFFYILFFLGMTASGLGLYTKWLKLRHENEIEDYRATIKEILTKYGADAHFLLEKYRLELPANVLAAGFFRNITESNNNNNKNSNINIQSQ
jgi:hypothetical protein